MCVCDVIPVVSDLYHDAAAVIIKPLFQIKVAVCYLAVVLLNFHCK